MTEEKEPAVGPGLPFHTDAFLSTEMGKTRDQLVDWVSQDTFKPMHLHFMPLCLVSGADGETNRQISHCSSLSDVTSHMIPTYAQAVYCLRSIHMIKQGEAIHA